MLDGDPMINIQTMTNNGEAFEFDRLYKVHEKKKLPRKTQLSNCPPWLHDKYGNREIDYKKEVKRALFEGMP